MFKEDNAATWDAIQDSDATQKTKLASKKLRFVDFFSGLGGFHVGLAKAGHICVFSCELDPQLRELYEINHGIKPHDDIRSVNELDVPSHDILCAGFPCQPFSLAGKKRGSECPESGRLIDHVIRIAKYHKPKYILLENVPNIITIANGSFWNYLTSSFEAIGYEIQHQIISPTDLGVPQNRKRVFVLGIRNDVDASSFSWPSHSNLTLPQPNLEMILNKNFPHKKLELQKKAILALWQSLLDELDIDSLAAVSLAAPEFGANYPADFSKIPLSEMKQYRGAYGASLHGCKSWAELLELMPSYTRKAKSIPSWIVKSAFFSREIYWQNRSICNRWAKKLNKTNNSWQILEWRGHTKKLDIYSHLVQFRASGIRVMKSEIAPSLIAMTPTQIPIIPSESRYISVHEAAKLQNLHTLRKLPANSKAAYKALGNAVNARVVELIGKNINKSIKA